MFVYINFHRQAKFLKSVEATDPIVRWIAEVVAATLGENKKKMEELVKSMQSAERKKEFIDFALYARDDKVLAFNRFYNRLLKGDSPPPPKEFFSPLADFLGATRKQYYRWTKVEDYQLLELLGITDAEQIKKVREASKRKGKKK